MHIRPSIRLSALPRALPLEARMRVARDAGFEGLEIDVSDGQADRLRKAADAAGLAIHSIHTWENYHKPLCSADPAIRDAGIAATLATLEAARIVGADAMLIVPGVVGADATYDEVDRRSRDVIRSAILPEAERLGVVLAVENVWNGFLLSPYDFVRYVESFDSPHVRLCLDLGNMVFGHPEGWVDIAARCAIQIHAKDHRHWKDEGRYRTLLVGDGTTDWPKVRAALERAGFAGWAVMAEIEACQSFLPRTPFFKVRQIASQSGWNPALRLIETRLSRRMVNDAMRRFRRHVAPEHRSACSGPRHSSGPPPDHSPA